MAVTPGAGFRPRARRRDAALFLCAQQRGHRRGAGPAGAVHAGAADAAGGCSSARKGLRPAPPRSGVSPVGKRAGSCRLANKNRQGHEQDDQDREGAGARRAGAGAAPAMAQDAGFRRAGAGGRGPKSRLDDFGAAGCACGWGSARACPGASSPWPSRRGWCSISARSTGAASIPDLLDWAERARGVRVGGFRPGWSRMVVDLAGPRRRDRRAPRPTR